MSDGLVYINDADFRGRAPSSGYGAKRGLDFVLSAALLFVILPVFLLLVIAVCLDGGPAFFGHRRTGRGGQEFRCWKFRSMRPGAEAALRQLLDSDPAARREWETTHKLRNDPRVTPLGRILRTTSLDELPQLWNVLRGEMSLVGPRPVTRDELTRYYGPATGLYLLASPGVTGLWQVSGRSSTDYAERVRLDVAYVRDTSLRGDLAILGRTVGAVLRGRGAC